ncbi:hypothetical protein V8E36_002512 [Tilletia maclaganii]
MPSSPSCRRLQKGDWSPGANRGSFAQWLHPLPTALGSVQLIVARAEATLHGISRSSGTIGNVDYDATKVPAKTDSANVRIGFNDGMTHHGIVSSPGRAGRPAASIHSRTSVCGPLLRGQHRQPGGLNRLLLHQVRWRRDGTRLIPDGTVKSVQFGKTPRFVEFYQAELDTRGATAKDANSPTGGVVSRTGPSPATLIRSRSATGPNARHYSPDTYDLGSNWSCSGTNENGTSGKTVQRATRLAATPRPTRRDLELSRLRLHRPGSRHVTACARETHNQGSFDVDGQYQNPQQERRRLRHGRRVRN